MMWNVFLVLAEYGFPLLLCIPEAAFSSVLCDIQFDILILSFLELVLNCDVVRLHSFG